jgi:hypothetical protein
MATPRVAILNSVNEKRFTTKLEKLVSKKLKGFEVKIVHGARQEELYQTLLEAPEAIIWISHGSKSQMSLPLGAEPQILDQEGDNVAPLFQVLSTTTQFLGVISCYSEQALIYQQVNVESLQSGFSSKKKIEAYAGLKKTIKRLLKTRFEKRENSKTQNPHKISIKKIGGTKRGLKVFSNNFFLGLVFSDSEFLTDKPNLRAIRLEIPRGTNQSSDMWGTTRIWLNENELTLFTDKNGNPLGTNSRVYLKKL